MVLQGARRALYVGAGGAAGTAGRAGGRMVDALPGPRRLDRVGAAERLSEAVALAGPDTHGPNGIVFGEADMARHLGEPTVLVDPHPGPAVVAAGLADAVTDAPSLAAAGAIRHRLGPRTELDVEDERARQR